MHEHTSPLKIAFGFLAAFLAVIVLFSATYIVKPGTVGVVVTMGDVAERFSPPGFGWKKPFITSVHEVSVRAQNRPLTSDCFSSDLQHLNTTVAVIYRIPEKQAVTIYKDYSGDPFDALISSRVQEALKEATATMSAEHIAKNREIVKKQTLEASKKKIGDLLDIVDINIVNIGLSPQLTSAIEAKMVQEQEVAKAQFIKQRTQTEAETAAIKAKGEAEAIQIRGDALTKNPRALEMQLLEKWDGRAPLVIGSGGATGTQFILPITHHGNGTNQ